MQQTNKAVSYYVTDDLVITPLPPSRPRSTSSSPSSNQPHQCLPLLIQNRQSRILNDLSFQPRSRSVTITKHNTFNNSLPPPLAQPSTRPPNNHPLLDNRTSRDYAARTDLGVRADIRVRVHRGETVDGYSGVDVRARVDRGERGDDHAVRDAGLDSFFRFFGW